MDDLVNIKQKFITLLQEAVTHANQNRSQVSPSTQEYRISNEFI